MDELTAATRERMIRNHLHFDYAEARTMRPMAGRMESVTCPDSGTTLQEFMDQMREFLENRTTGLYKQSRGGDPMRNGRAYWDVFFELESDLEAFTKNFLVLHKLSN